MAPRLGNTNGYVSVIKASAANISPGCRGGSHPVQLPHQPTRSCVGCQVGTGRTYENEFPMASASRSRRSRSLPSARSPRRLLGRSPFLGRAARSPGVLRDSRRRGTRPGGIQGSAAGADSTSSAGGLQNFRRRSACRGGTLDRRTYHPVALDLDHDAHAFTSFMKGRQIFPRM